MPIKVLGANGSGTYDAVASGIIYAADHGARVINLSLAGSAASQTLQDAVSYAYSKVALLVAAAGNSGSNIVTYPAALDNVMAVAASDTTDQRASFSNYNTYISVTAPGVDVYSTLWSSTSGSTYGYKSGTSMATPFVTGLAGLLIAQEPALSNGTLRTQIESSADDINTAGWDEYTGHGRINALRALSGTISGRITESGTGTPLYSAVVEVLQAGEVVQTVSSALDGSYQIGQLPPGTYDIRVSHPSHTSRTQNNVLVRAAQETKNIDVALDRFGAVGGKVTSGRKALAGATVKVLQGSQVIGTATTDTLGNYHIANLVAGTYDVVASATRYKSQTKTGIVVTSGEKTTVNFSLSK